jgi:hypothetical protein
MCDGCSGDAGVQVVQAPFQSRNANAYAERVVRSPIRLGASVRSSSRAPRRHSTPTKERGRSVGTVSPYQFGAVALVTDGNTSELQAERPLSLQSRCGRTLRARNGMGFQHARRVRTDSL